MCMRVFIVRCVFATLCRVVRPARSRCRLHRYEAGMALGIHRDRGELPMSGVDEHRELRFDVMGEHCVSRCSLLIYLDDVRHAVVC